MANNPSQEGFKAIRDFYPSLHIALVVSMGTGKYTPEEIKQADILTCLRSYKLRDAISGVTTLIKSALQVSHYLCSKILCIYYCVSGYLFRSRHRKRNSLISLFYLNNKLMHNNYGFTEYF